MLMIFHNIRYGFINTARHQNFGSHTLTCLPLASQRKVHLASTEPTTLAMVLISQVRTRTSSTHLGKQMFRSFLFGDS